MARADILPLTPWEILWLERDWRVTGWQEGQCGQSPVSGCLAREVGVWAGGRRSVGLGGDDALIQVK